MFDMARFLYCYCASVRSSLIIGSSFVVTYGFVKMVFIFVGVVGEWCESCRVLSSTLGLRQVRACKHAAPRTEWKHRYLTGQDDLG